LEKIKKIKSEIVYKDNGGVDKEAIVINWRQGLKSLVVKRSTFKLVSQQT
jgi:hypothetical protein